MDTPTQSHGNGPEGANRPAGEAAARGDTEDRGCCHGSATTQRTAERTTTQISGCVCGAYQEAGAVQGSTCNAGRTHNRGMGRGCADVTGDP